MHALPWSSALPLALKLALVRWDGRGRVVGYGPLHSGRGYAALSARLDLRLGLVKYVGASEKGSGGAIVCLTGDMGVWRKLSVRFGSPTSRSPMLANPAPTKLFSLPPSKPPSSVSGFPQGTFADPNNRRRLACERRRTHHAMSAQRQAMMTIVPRTIPT